MPRPFGAVRPGIAATNHHMSTYTIPPFAATPAQLSFLKALSLFGVKSDQVSRAALSTVARESFGHAYPPAWIVKDRARLRGRGLFRVPELDKFTAGAYGDADGVHVGVVAKRGRGTVKAAVPVKGKRSPKVFPSIPAPTAGPTFVAADVSAPGGAERSAVGLAAVHNHIDDGLRPVKPAWFVPGDLHKVLVKLFTARVFAPLFIYGHKGNGKTTSILAAAADAGREVFRVNITSETCEDDLIGGLRLIGGETVWADGPVTVAMKRGAILLLDEMDRGDRKILCLQPILEGNPLLIKKTGRVVIPAAGFTVAATGNTRGRGSDDNRYSGANVQDEAMLDRFPLAFKHEYPSKTVERRMLEKVQEACGYSDAKFIASLVEWAAKTRETFEVTGDGDFVTTRNLVDACRLLPVIDDQIEVVSGICRKFDDVVSGAFVALFKATQVQLDPPAPALGAPVNGNVVNYSSGTYGGPAATWAYGICDMTKPSGVRAIPADLGDRILAHLGAMQVHVDGAPVPLYLLPDGAVQECRVTLDIATTISTIDHAVLLQKTECGR